MTISDEVSGLKFIDFQCLEDVNLEPLTATFKVQLQRDGNVYMTEQPKRVRNEAIFRDDNSSLSLGKNGRYYFVFTLKEELIGDLPAQLVRQASEIAGKVTRQIINKMD